jgi:hypothetical protein
MAKELQSERIGIRFTPTEARMLAELSELVGLNMTDVVRQAIRREYAERVGTPPRLAKRAKPKRAAARKRGDANA